MNEIQQQLLALEARVEARVQDIRASHDWWTCRRGCDRCCHQLARPLELTWLEWSRIDQAVAALPDSIRADVEQNIQQLLVQIAENSLGSQVTCPYLDEQEGACRIYEARPIACRTYGFFVARDGDDYCQMIEQEVSSPADSATEIVWGNADAIHYEYEQMFGALIPFHVHYDRSA